MSAIEFETTGIPRPTNVCSLSPTDILAARRLTVDKSLKVVFERFLVNSLSYSVHLVCKLIESFAICSKIQGGTAFDIWYKVNVNHEG